MLHGIPGAIVFASVEITAWNPESTKLPVKLEALSFSPGSSQNPACPQHIDDCPKQAFV